MTQATEASGASRALLGDPGAPAAPVSTGGVGYLTIVIVGVLGIAVAALCSLAFGATAISPLDVLRSIFGDAGQRVEPIVDGRLNRTILGIVAGAAIAVAGGVMQGVTRNPLADPGILGINAGAALAVILGIYWIGLSSLTQYVWLALLGAALAAAFIYVLAGLGPRSSQPLTMALGGAALTAICTSIMSGIMVTSDETLDVFRFWQVGSVAGRDLSQLTIVWVLLAIGLVISLASTSVLNALALGDDMARALGQKLGTGRLMAATGGVLLAAATTAACGPIGFVGLVVPHMVRLVVGPDYRKVLLASAFGGPVLILFADTVGRVINPPAEVSVGIVTALIGAPVLVILVRRMRSA
ncbi:FecCD family ABC transporter permease [Dermacoccaceae bacterium W4C1]